MAQNIFVSILKIVVSIALYIIYLLMALLMTVFYIGLSLQLHLTLFVALPFWITMIGWLVVPFSILTALVIPVEKIYRDIELPLPELFRFYLGSSVLWAPIAGIVLFWVAFFHIMEF